MRNYFEERRNYLFSENGKWQDGKFLDRDETEPITLKCGGREVHLLSISPHTVRPLEISRPDTSGSGGGRSAASGGRSARCYTTWRPIRRPQSKGGGSGGPGSGSGGSGSRGVGGSGSGGRANVQRANQILVASFCIPSKHFARNECRGLHLDANRNGSSPYVRSSEPCETNQ